MSARVPDAFSHAEQFPVRADLNVHVMYTYYAHRKRDYKSEANITTRPAFCRERMGNYKDAERTLKL